MVIVFRVFCLSGQENPKLPGGLEDMCRYIVKNTVYPQIALEKNISGTVLFTVSKTGEVTHVKIRKGVSAELDSAALKVIRSLPRCMLSKMNGMLIETQYNLPIVFSISQDGKPNVTQCDNYGK